MSRFFSNDTTLPVYNGVLAVEDGVIMTTDATILHAESFAENIRVMREDQPFTGGLSVVEGNPDLTAETFEGEEVYLTGRSLIHSAPLTAEAFTRSVMGRWGQYIVSIGLLLFAFSTAISWSYYGGRAVTYLFGTKYVIYYRMLYVVGFFIASFTDTTIVWNLSYITIVIMTIPNLVGILILHKDMRNVIREYWRDFKRDWPNEKLPMGERK